MKKTLKIIGISLASLVGLVLLVGAIAVGMVTNSGRLTKLVKQYAPKFVNCEMQLGKADLTLFRTFPNVGLEIENVALINPMAGSASDTLAHINSLIVVADAKKFLKNKEIVVRKCILENAFVNLYTDSLGQSNLNVFVTKEDEDTTASAFDYLVDIEEVRLENSTVLYADDRSGMRARMQGLNLDLDGRMRDADIQADLSLNAADLGLNMKDIALEINDMNLGFDGHIADLDNIDGRVQLHTPDAFLSLKEPYLKHDTLSINLPLQLRLSDLKTHLDQAQIGLNQYLINISGDARKRENGDFNLDLSLNTNTLVIEDVLTYLPEQLQKQLSSMEYAGKLRITGAEVKGTLNDSLMPRIAANVVTDNATVNVPSLPYPFTEVNLNAHLDLDLNGKANRVSVNSLNAKFHRSNLTVNGLVDDLLGEIGLKLHVQGDVPMADLKGFLPKNLKLGGHNRIDLDTDFTVKQLLAALDDYNLNLLNADGTFKIKDFTLDRDSLHVVSPALDLGLTLPARAKGKGRQGAYLALKANQLEAQMGKRLQADMRQPDITLSADHFTGGLETMLLDAALDFSHLDFKYDTINAQMDGTALTVVTLPEQKAKGLKAHVTFDGNNVDAEMGRTYALNSSSLKINASVDQNQAKNDFLNRWNPTADFMLGNAVVKIDGLKEDIRVSNIDFVFDADGLDFKKSTFRIGQSDMSLQGRVAGVKEWMEDHKNLMEGELLLTSDLLEINEILDLTSGLGAAEATDEPDETENAEDNPFMVPEGVDFTFGIKTKKSIYDNFDLNNLSGSLTVKDGTLILREMGFTNKAAEMQLTAMYQSPRKNNLFLALDFHLLKVQINDLLHMVPYIDTLVPMLKTFDGQAEFHIGAETRLKSNYAPKISTLRAAADIEGKNLSVNDKFTFTKITDLLDVSTNGAYRVDSLDVQLTAFKDEIELWPSQIAIGKYKVTVDGRMTLDKNGEYHLSVTESPLPLRLGLKISGPLDNLEYKLENVKYPNLYKPAKRSDTEQMYMDLKKRIADRLKENVR